MALQEYDPEIVDIILFGAPASGFADDSMVTIEYDENDFTFKVGVKGEVTRSKNLKNTATIKVRLMQSSKFNAFLSGIRLQDLKSNGGAGVGACLILDRNGGSSFGHNECWIEKAPTIVYAGEAEAREWTIRVGPGSEMVEAGS